MKELYVSPELEVLCFAPVENLAKSPIQWSGKNTMLEGGGDTSEVVEYPISDNPEGDMN